MGKENFDYDLFFEIGSINEGKMEGVELIIPAQIFVDYVSSTLEENGNRVPITEKIIMPKMEGALIVAEGGDNAEIKTSIIQAVEALTGLPAHKIQVLEMKVENF